MYIIENNKRNNNKKTTPTNLVLNRRPPLERRYHTYDRDLKEVFEKERKKETIYTKNSSCKTSPSDFI